MDQSRLCSDCFLLIRRQLITTHANLVERNHVHNDTVYECQTCNHLIRLSHVPHKWSVIEDEEHDHTHNTTAKSA